MLIDWFTVAAQVVNFLVLVWLLKRFLYRPVLDAVAAREKRIADDKAAADADRHDALQLRERLAQDKAEFDAQRERSMDQAIQAASAERNRLLDAARAESDLMRKKRQDELEAEYRKLSGEIATRIRAQAYSIARRMMSDLADADLDERIARVLAGKLAGLSAAEFDGVEIAVHSAYALTETAQAEIAAAIRRSAARDIAVRFEQAPELVAGIELVMPGRKIAWSASDYLGTLDKDVNDLIRAGKHG